MYDCCVQRVRIPAEDTSVHTMNSNPSPGVVRAAGECGKLEAPLGQSSFHLSAPRAQDSAGHIGIPQKMFVKLRRTDRRLKGNNKERWIYHHGVGPDSQV